VSIDESDWCGRNSRAQLRRHETALYLEAMMAMRVHDGHWCGRNRRAQLRTHKTALYLEVVLDNHEP
jgi:hypothetical protein